jgi:hypothetical protein
MHVTVSSTAPAAVRPVLERVRRLYVELFAGMSFFSSTGASTTGCEGTCFGNPGGGRIGYLLSPHLAIEVATGGLALPHRTTRSASASFEGAPISAPTYQEDADWGASFWALSIARRFFDRTPLTVRLWTGVAFATTSVSGAGFFDNGNNYYSQGNGASYATPLVAPEVRVGYRLGRNVMVDVGVAAFFFYVRPLSPLPTTTVVFGDSPLFPGPTFARGLGWTFPITGAVHLDIL